MYGYAYRKVVSRQRVWQLRMKAEGRCMLCGKPRATVSYCRKHANLRNMLNRKRYWRLKEEENDGQANS